MKQTNLVEQFLNRPKFEKKMCNEEGTYVPNATNPRLMKY